MSTIETCLVRKLVKYFRKRVKMKKVSKKLQAFIDSISTVARSHIPEDSEKIYYSKYDGSYLTRVGMEKKLEILLKLGITEQIQDASGERNVASIGFNPVEQKWYGWSHRAIFGFGVGSECKKGDCGYIPSNKEDFAQSCLDFWGKDEYSVGDDKVEFAKSVDFDDKNEVEIDGVLVTFTYNDKVPNKILRGTEYSHFSPFPENWGKGEWTARTLVQAKEMAIDFAVAVS